MATYVSNQQINDYINSILQNPSLTDAQRASTINAATNSMGLVEIKSLMLQGMV